MKRKGLTTCLLVSMFHRELLFTCAYLNRKLQIYTAPTKAKARELDYSQTLIQNKINRQRVRFRESGRQTDRPLWWMVFGVDTGMREVGKRR